MENELRNSEQQNASSNTAVSTETQVNEVQETRVTELIPATPETHLPRGIMIIGSLSESLYKAGLGILCIALAGVVTVVTFMWAQGFVSTDLYFKIVQAIIELMQNMIIV